MQALDATDRQNQDVDRCRRFRNHQAD
jgi:hypothetical protein